MDTARSTDLPADLRPLVPEIPHGEYPYAFGWLAMAYCQLYERLDRLVAAPGNKRALLTALADLRDEMAGDFGLLQSSMAQRIAPEGGVQ